MKLKKIKAWILHIVIRCFCKHRDSNTIMAFENGDSIQKCNKCGKEFNEHIGRLGYLGFKLQIMSKNDL